MSSFESQSLVSQDISRPDLELEVLKALQARENVKQRDIAEIVGVSLGMTNAILKRLSQKGLVTIKRVNNRNLRYAVSPDGMEAIAKRSYRYFKRTIKNVVYYRDAIETLVRRAGRDGFTRLVLIGESDLSFILEHFCEKYDLSFDTSELETQASEDAAWTFTVYGEDCPVDGDGESSDTIHLQHLLRG